MRPVQAYNIFKYISFLQRPHTVRAGLAAKYFLSWEDAMWSILHSYGIKAGTVLVPSFWCLDVIDNFKTHGLNCEYYALDRFLQPEEGDFYTKLAELKPKIVVIFNACGIQNNLSRDWSQVMTKIPKDTIVIWDCVHSILDPSEVEARYDNLFVIDSWRKVMPLQGAACYGTQRAIARLAPEPQENLYKFKVHVLWFVYQMFLWLQAVFCPFERGSQKGGVISRLSIFFGRQAERYMMEGYDVIGKSQRGNRANPLMVYLHRFIDFQKIHERKEQSCKAWAQKLQPQFESGRMFPICRDVAEYKCLRGYPVGLPTTHAFAQIADFRKSGILVRSELEGCPCTKEFKVILLPIS